MKVSDRLVDRLCAISRSRHSTPWGQFDWPSSIDPADAWYSSPSLLTIAGTPLASQIDEDTTRKLALYEAKAFFSMNVHGERLLLEGAASRLYRPECASWSDYLVHLIEEEVHHSSVFARFCSEYADGLYPDRKVAFEREHAPGEADLLFFARIVVFEEVVDAINRRTADDDQVAPLVRAIHAYHHEDETRHLAFGRHVVQELWRTRRDEWSPDVIERVRAELVAFLRASWRELSIPDVYRDAGIDDATQVSRLVAAHPEPRARRRELSARAIDFLTRLELMTEEPEL